MTARPAAAGYGDLSDPADHDGARDVILRSFAFRVPPGGTAESAFAEYRDRVGVENFRCWRVRGQVAGALCTYPAAQWFGGRDVAMHGVAAVGVAPEHRGAGVAKGLMTALLRELYDKGVPLATLYPSTQALYRTVGFEQGGTWAQHEVAPAELTVRERKPGVVRVSPDSAALRQSHRDAGQRAPGNLVRSGALWERLCEGATAYVIGTEEDPEGHLVFTQERGVDGFVIEVRDMAANTPAAVGRLWSFLGDHRSLATAIRWAGPVVDLLSAHLPENRVRIAQQKRWMLRVVDLRRALAERGYHGHVVEELHLAVRDPILDRNHGRFILSVNGGRGTVVEGGRGKLVVDVRMLAPLYTGLFSATQLSRLGWLRGDDHTLGIADRVFAGPEPWMADRF